MTDVSVASPPPRSISAWPALDLVKFAGVTGMILVHSFYWVATVYGRLIVPTDSWVFVWLSRLMFLGFFSLMLPLSAGCAFRFALSPTDDLPRLSLRQCLKVWANGLFLAAIGFFMNVLAVGWTALWAWNVLQFVGLSLSLIGTLLALLPVHAVAGAGIGVLLCQTFVLETGLSATETYACQALFGDPSGFHGWPLFPWFSTVVFGFFLSHAYLKLGSRQKFSSLLAILGGIGLLGGALAGDWLPALDPESLMGGKLFTPQPGLILTLLGIASLMFLAAGRLAKVAPLRPHGIVNCFSKGILWIYVIHLVIGCRLDAYLREVTQSQSWLLTFGPVGKTCAIIGFPLGLLLSSWLIGYLVVRLLHETRFRLQLRKVR